MNDQLCPSVPSPEQTEQPTQPTDPAVRVAEAQAEAVAATEQPAAVNGEGDSANRHAEAGRKGAHRVHQLMQLGLLYEQEHGLKRGRQRLRQLIQEGKLYEQEHGLARKPRGPRRDRLGGDQLVQSFLRSLLRMVKPAYRDKLGRLMKALDVAA